MNATRLSRFIAPARTFAVSTLGCKVNQVESDAIGSALLRLGLQPAGRSDKPDLAVLNACAVTSTASAKSRKRVAALLRTAGRVILTGCIERATLPRRHDAARVLTVAKLDLLEALADLAGSPSFKTTEAPALFTPAGADRTRGFVKVQDGCDAFCSYCIIPYVRSTVSSRTPGQVLADARAHLQAGRTELVLTGIHLGAWGRSSTAPGAPPDAGGAGMELAELVEAVLALPGLARLRLSSIELHEVSDRLVRLVAMHPLMARHLHIPLQSGSAGVLGRMNRRYTPNEFIDRVEAIRQRIPYIGLTSDLIVGFPGESDDNFRESVELCRRAGFSRIHLFPFSPRPGTKAADLPDRLPERVIRARMDEMQKVERELELAYKHTLMEHTLSVMTEHRRDRRTKKLTGWSSEYVRVLFDGPDALKSHLVNVTPTNCTPEHIEGKTQKEETTDEHG